MQQNNLVTGRDIVIVGQQAWDVEIGSNNKNLAVKYSQHNRVLYVNPALDRITLIRKKKEPKIQKRLNVIRGREDGLVSLQDNLWNLYPDTIVESITWIKSKFLFGILNKINNRRFARSISKAIKKLGFKNIILFNDNDIFRSFYLKELLKPDISIYYMRDFVQAVDYWKYHALYLEPKLIAKSDLCLGNSTYYTGYCKKINPYSYYVGQGCDLEMFSNLEDKTPPEEFNSIPKPIIGYVGAIQSIRLDIDLIAYIAETRPDWSIVLVGPEDEVFKECKLHGINNVYFLGSKPMEQLPSYINAFDVCFNPQVVNQVTIGNYPRKVDEYLAMGKPVVGTKTDAMSIFAEQAYLATTKEEYITFIEDALRNNDPSLPEKRRKLALSHTWDKNTADVYFGINNYLLHRKNKRK